MPKRRIYLDMLRIIAIFFVIFNHTFTSGFQLYQTIINDGFTVKYIVYSFFAVICKVAVPLFYMISGALLLKKDESYKSLFKRIFRIVVVLICVSLLYYIMLDLNYNFSKFRIIDFAKSIYSTNIIPPLWYMYSYIGFLLTLPFLTKISKTLVDKDIVYLMGLCLVFEIFKFSVGALVGVGMNTNLTIFVLSSIIYYPLLGYYIDSKMDISKLTLNKIIVLFIVMVLVSILGAYFNYIDIIKTSNSTSQSYLGLFSVINAPVIFVSIRFLFEKKQIPNSIRKIINIVGSSTFGIYLFDELLRRLVYWKIYGFLYPTIPSLLSSMIGVLFCIIVGTILVLVLKRIKIVNKYM